MRYLVIGTSGAGKSTFARAFASALAVPHVELDELFWAENWSPRPTKEFTMSVSKVASEERWVIDGNYTVVRDVLWPLATHVVWLNFSRTVVFPRVIWRTIKRTVLRQRLWHGNRETIRKAFFSRKSILLWSLRTYTKNQNKYARLREGPEYAHLSWVELKSPTEAIRFLTAISRTDA